MINKFKQCKEDVKGRYFASTAAVNLRPGEGKTVNMNAVSWTSSTKLSRIKHVIGTTGTTYPGEPHHKRTINLTEVNGKKCYSRGTRPIGRPKILEDLFKGFSAIDVHDHFRQGILKIEVNWVTNNWRIRVFATLFGMHCTDAFLAYRHEHLSSSTGVMTFTKFCSMLARSLTHLDGTQTFVRYSQPRVQVSDLVLHHYF